MTVKRKSKVWGEVIRSLSQMAALEIVFRVSEFQVEHP